MKIIITVESYYPLKNGVQEITQRYAEYLSKKNEVIVITRSVDGSPEEEIYNGVKIKRVNIYTKRSLYYGNIKMYKEMLHELCFRGDIMINVCLQTVFTDCILRNLDQYECKKILYFHGMAHFSFPKIEKVDFHDICSWLLNVIRWRTFYNFNKRNISKYDAIIHLHKMDNTYKMCKKLSNNNYVLENVAHIDQTILNDGSDVIDNEKPYIMIANYIHDKNQELALKSYYLSKSTRKLVFVGSYESKYLNRLKRIAKKYENSFPKKSIEFIVGENHTITMKRLANSYALLHSSKSEKYPVVLSEALACGVPFIATDTGITRFLDGGIICTNSREFTKAINSLEESIYLRNNLLRIGKKYSNNFQDEKNNYLILDGIIASLGK